MTKYVITNPNSKLQSIETFPSTTEGDALYLEYKGNNTSIFSEKDVFKILDKLAGKLKKSPHRIIPESIEFAIRKEFSYLVFGKPSILEGKSNELSMELDEKEENPCDPTILPEVIIRVSRSLYCGKTPVGNGLYFNSHIIYKGIMQHLLWVRHYNIPKNSRIKFELQHIDNQTIESYLPEQLNQNLVNFIKGDRENGCDCFAFARYMTLGSQQGKLSNIQYLDANSVAMMSKSSNDSAIGECIGIFNLATNAQHYAIRIHDDLYLQVVGINGSLAVSTLKEMVSSYSANAVAKCAIQKTSDLNLYSLFSQAKAYLPSLRTGITVGTAVALHLMTPNLK